MRITLGQSRTHVHAFYFGTSFDCSAGFVVVAGASAAGAAPGTDETGRFSITPPPAATGLLLMNANPNVAAKKTTAATPVDFDKKLEEPVAPNRLPEAPEPKDAPMSAPLPCCSSTRPMMTSADNTWTTMMMVCKLFIYFPVG